MGDLGLCYYVTLDVAIADGSWNCQGAINPVNTVKALNHAALILNSLLFLLAFGCLIVGDFSDVASFVQHVTTAIAKVSDWNFTVLDNTEQKSRTTLQTVFLGQV